MRKYTDPILRVLFNLYTYTFLGMKVYGAEKVPEKIGRAHV